MPQVIGVRFQNAGKLYYFDPGSLWPQAGDAVIVETARGLEFAQVVTGVLDVSQDKVTAPLKSVKRLATADDKRQHETNLSKKKEAREICQDKIREHRLDMKLVDVEYTFDGGKLIAYFTANGRVDFRQLVKDLAQVFRTRIELKQIGVRDEAKMIGGLGPCGRPLCCAQFLGDFQPVSIKMAKEQNLSLNPTKISGLCGRLMCCLQYEQCQYEQARKGLPRQGKEVMTPSGKGLVLELDLLRECALVRLQSGESNQPIWFEAKELKRLTPSGRPEERSHPAKVAAAEEDDTHPTAVEEFLETPVDMIEDDSLPLDSLS